jgi:xanthine dehydrogenase YagR molybdenum-binding subunit
MSETVETTVAQDQLTPHAVGAALSRRDGPAKVTGTARYAFEQDVENACYLHPVQASIALGRVSSIDVVAARDMPGVIAVLTHENAPRLASAQDAELAILQDDTVAFRGQIIGGVVAETPEIARQAANLVHPSYEQYEHDVELSADRDDLYGPDKVLPGYDADTADGDVEAALAAAAVTLDATYSTPMYHNNPMEPHASVAIWGADGVTVYESTQGAHAIASDVAGSFGLEQHQVRVVSPHVGGGFGSKAFTHAPVILAVMAARTVAGRAVKLALTRQQMFSLVGYRTPTIQRIRFGADSQGRLSAVSHDVVEQTSRIKEFAEQTAIATRVMYSGAHRRTTHRLAALDVPVPTIMRAPGETPGMYALESAMDEMAIACGLDPVEFRIRNEPEVSPESGRPFSSRNLVACLREGAHRFGWQGRDPAPGARQRDGWLVGTGVAASMYPVNPAGGQAEATIRVRDGGYYGGRYEIRIDGADIGTGTWTALTQVAADALEVGVDDVDLQIGDSALPVAPGAGGSQGMATWGAAVVETARMLREQHGREPAPGVEVHGERPPNPAMDRFSMHAFGAQFAEVRVHADTGEVRVPRMLGVFAVGRMINATTGRSQLVGGMTMGLSMALHEHSVLDPRFGHVVNHDLAEYHIATNADVGAVDAYWIEEQDPYVNPMGSKGIGELGIVGSAAAVANAAHHATGIRVRDLPLTPDKFLR